MEYDIVIVGGGPAGLTAGIYAVRRKLKTLIVERQAFGGQMLLTNDIENWPGDKLVSGKDLSDRMEAHASSLGVDFLFDEVKGIQVTEGFNIILRNNEVKCKAVVLAMGGQHKKLKVVGEEEYSGKGVSYCATCDAPFFRGKAVAVIGGGNMACEDAIYLNEIAGKTYLIAGGRTADESRWDKVQNSNVEVFETNLTEILGEEFVKAIKCSDGTKKDVEGVFISVGSKPSVELAKESGVKLDERGFIDVDCDMKTNVPGIYAAGDITGGVPQISTAVGQAATAALRAYSYIKSKN